MKQIGLINPITVVKNVDTQKITLIAGAHRLEAYRQLGYADIPCNIVDLDGLHSELAEIDENLIRKELHFIDRGEQFSRRKEIYEELYPETKHGGDRKSNEIKLRNPQLDTASFVDDTSSKTGVSSRVIYEEIQIAENLTPEAKETIEKNDISKTESLKISRMTPESQVKVLPYIEQGKTVNEAVSDIRREERHEAIKQKFETVPDVIANGRVIFVS